MHLQSHPAAELFPMMGDDELRALADDIRKNGQHHPIILFEGKILDGRNRARACDLAGLEPKTKEWDGRHGSPVAFVLSENLHRRHLSPSQVASIAAESAALFEEEARGRQAQGGREKVPANLQEAGEAAELAAKLCGVSPRSVYSALKVKEKGAPALVQAVRNGEVAVSAAAEVADLPEEEQEQLVASGPKAVKEAAKAKRTSKKPPKGQLTEEQRAEVRRQIAKEQREASEPEESEAPMPRRIPTRPRDGMQFARIAVLNLKQIQANDLEREEAFRHVKEWIGANESKTQEDEVLRLV